MNARKLFLVLLATFLSSAVLADEIGSGEIDPSYQGSMTTSSTVSLADEDATASATTDDASLWMRLLDWLE